MEDTLETEFITKFYSLSGTSLKERNKNLNHLLEETQAGLNNRKIDLKKLFPKTPLEAHLKIKSLVYFKCVKELFDVLKSENPAHIDQVLKHSSCFLPEACTEITPKNLTTEIFPNLSFITKEKLLNKLSCCLDDPYKCDTYFEAIKESYGLYLATKLLPACTPELIMNYVEFYNIEVTSSQLLMIFKRQPNLTEWILEMLNKKKEKRTIRVKYIKAFKYLATHNVSLFSKLFDRYSPDLSLGPKETDTFIKTCIKLNNFENVKLYKILHHKQISKTFGKDFENFYYKVFPKQLNILKINVNSSLKLLDGLHSNKTKLKLFMTTFEKIYGNQNWEHSDFMLPKLIEWMSPTDREIFLENYSRPTNITEENWISYNNTEKSIPWLMKKISLLCSVKGRIRCILALLKTCEINHDTAALLQLLKYINNKHRNENYTVLEEFLCTLNSSIPTSFFNHDHWAEIKNCIQYFMMNSKCNYYCYELLEKYIFYRLTHGLSIREELRKWIKEFPHLYSICKKNPKFEKLCLEEFENICLQDYKDEYCIRYLYDVSCYNRKHNKNKIVISIKEEYIECIKRALKDDSLSYNYNAQFVACDFIIENFTKAEQSGLVEQLFSLSYFDDYKTIISIIKSHPEVLIKHPNIIFVKNDTNLFQLPFLKQFCNMYTHLKIPETISKLCYDIINDETYDGHKFKVAVIALAILSTADEFIEMSSSYYINDASSNIKIMNKENIYKRRQAIINSFSNIIPISKSWEAILEFYKGDYMKFVQKRISIAAFQTGECKLPSLSQMRDRTVPVRKFVLFLPAIILSIEAAHNLLREIMKNTQTPAICRLIFKTSFSLFLQNPTDYSWNIFMRSVENVYFNTDEEACNLLINPRKLPKLYFNRYIKFAWSTLNKYTEINIIIENGKNKVLNLVNPQNVMLLSPEFIFDIIGTHLFKCTTLTVFQKTVQSFTSKYLIYASGDEQERLKYIFNCLTELQISSDNITNTALKYRLLYNFVQQFCTDSMNETCTNYNVFNEFRNTWERLITPDEAFEEFIYIQLTSIYLITVEQKLNIAEVGKKLETLCDLLHGQKSLDIFLNILNNFVNKFYDLEFIGNSVENEIALIMSIVSDKCSNRCLQLVLSLMPSEDSITPSTKQRFENIMNMISQARNPLLQVALQKYLTKSRQYEEFDDY